MVRKEIVIVGKIPTRKRLLCTIMEEAFKKNKEEALRTTRRKLDISLILGGY